MRDKGLQNYVYHEFGAFKSGFEEYSEISGTDPHYWILIKEEFNASKIMSLSEFIDENYMEVSECYIDAKEPGVIKISFY